MKFKIDKEAFLRGIQRTQSIAEKRSTMPILSNILIEAVDETITITATDLEIGLKGDLEANIEATRQVVMMAHQAGIPCEGELGAVLGHEAGPPPPYEELFESGRGFTGSRAASRERPRGAHSFRYPTRRRSAPSARTRRRSRDWPGRPAATSSAPSTPCPSPGDPARRRGRSSSRR